MSSIYKARDPDKAYFITMTVVYWIDLFTRLNHRNTIIESLKYCQEKKGLEIYGYVIMPSHIHLLCRAQEGYELNNIVRDFKSFTARKLIRNINEEVESRREWLLEKFELACSHLAREQTYKVWQDGYHAIEIWSNKFIYQKLNYIHNNPVEEQIVEKPEDYLYSSARNYAGKEALLNVVTITPELKTTPKGSRLHKM